MDPLSDVLSLVKPRDYSSGGFEAGGEWSIRFSKHDGIKCFAVDSGECLLSIDGVQDVVKVRAGDCFLLPSGRAFRAASDLGLPSSDASNLYADSHAGKVVSWNGGGDFRLLGGHFTLTLTHAAVLLDMLPPIVHLRRESQKAAMKWSLQRMKEELRDSQPGSDMVVQHLAHLMLVEALRLHLVERADSGTGWLFALADKQVSAAVRAIHADPAHGWTIQTLASHAGMSRSAFAVRFRNKVGAAPMEYLTRWRMLLAGDKLVSSGETVTIISQSLGYESEAAFRTAFKRVMGCSPRQFLHGCNPLSPKADGYEVSSDGRLGIMAVDGRDRTTAD